MARSKNGPTQWTFQAPGPNWLPLELAPFHYVSDYVETVQEWANQFERLVARSAERARGAPSPPGGPDNRRPAVEYRFSSTASLVEQLRRGRKTAWIKAFATILEFDANRCAVALANKHTTHNGVFMMIGYHNDILKDEDGWNTLSRTQPDAAAWFRPVVKTMLATMHRTFENSVTAGASHIMARKNSPLAPFERVQVDQWTYFTVDDPSCITPDRRKWIDPLSNDDRFDGAPRAAATATGPRGEKLFSIHVIPGTSSAFSSSPELVAEEKCRSYLIGAMASTPDCPPGGNLNALRAKCAEEFPNLTDRGFERAYQDAKRVAGTECKWSQPGRKPARKSPQ